MQAVAVLDAHVQVCMTLSGLAAGFIGPEPRWKYVQGKYVNTAAALLQCLRLRHPAAFVLLDACVAQDEAFGNGSSEILYLVGPLIDTMARLHQQGLPKWRVSAAFERAKGMCLTACRSSALPTSFTLAHQRKPRSGLNYSRHMAAGPSIVTDFGPQLRKFEPEMDNSIVVALINEMLVPFSAPFSRKVWDDPPTVLTATINGPCAARSKALRDAVLLGSGSALLEQVSKGPQSRRIVLVNGSILRSFKHIGFKSHTGLLSTSIKSWKKQVGGDPWLADLTAILREHGITALVVSGAVDDRFLSYCLQHEVMCLDNVTTTCFKACSKLCNISPVVYLTDVVPSHIGNARFSLFSARFPETPARDVSVSHILLRPLIPDTSSGIWTFVLCGPCDVLAKRLEGRLIATVAKIRHSVKCGQVVYGHGHTSRQCCTAFKTDSNSAWQERPEKNETRLLDAVVGEEMCRILERYAKLRQGEQPQAAKTFEALTMAEAVYTRAIDCAVLLFRTTAIITPAKLPKSPS